MNPNILFKRNLGYLELFALTVLSTMTSIVVVYLIFSNKEIREAHPSKLLAAMSICEFITASQCFIYLLGAGNIACYFGI